MTYENIKAVILKEYKLSPASYRERFNTLRKDNNETYVMFLYWTRISNREVSIPLKNCVSYYCVIG